MASKPVSSKQFLIGIAVTVAVSVLSFIGTWKQISTQRAENQRVHDSQRLREINGAVSSVRQQLMSHAGALLELESCMSRKAASFQRCRPALDSFDAGALVEAWNNLDGTVRAATPFFTSGEEAPLLDRLLTIKKSHAASIDPLLPANSVESTSVIRAKIQATMSDLRAVEEALLTAVTKRARN